MSFKVVYNGKHGGFDLSPDAFAEYNRRTGKECAYADEIDRMDPILIQLVEEMGPAINVPHSRLKIKEFPEKYRRFLDWYEYDGNESVNIDYSAYLIYSVRCLKNNKSLTADQILSRIQEAYTEYDARPKSILHTEVMDEDM